AAGAYAGILAVDILPLHEEVDHVAVVAELEDVVLLVLVVVIDPAAAVLPRGCKAVAERPAVEVLHNRPRDIGAEAEEVFAAECDLELLALLCKGALRDDIHDAGEHTDAVD